VIILLQFQNTFDQKADIVPVLLNISSTCSSFLASWMAHLIYEINFLRL